MDSMGSTVPPQDLTADKILTWARRVDINGRSVPVLGKIPLVACLGRGGMGSVYYGLHPRLKIEVAVKVLPFFMADQDPGVTERFYREAQTAARVHSPHLVHVLDVDEDNGLVYIVMEYVHGISGSEYVKQMQSTGREGLDASEALTIVMAATRGLTAAHAEGIVHRDVKPSNIMIPRSKGGDSYLLQMSKLADLGLARPEGQDDLTAGPTALGTPGYMAPEQCEDAKKAGKPADVFAMGATLYTMLAGRTPFSGNSAVSVMAKTVSARHQPIEELRPDISLTISSVIDKCLAKDPAARYTDARALSKALKSCMSEFAKSSAGSSALLPGIGVDETTVFTKRRDSTLLANITSPPQIEPQPVKRLTRIQTRGKTARIEAPARGKTGRIEAPVRGKTTTVERRTRIGKTNILTKLKDYTHWPFDAHEAARRQKETATAAGLPMVLNLGLPGDVDLTLVLIPPGRFLMGSQSGEPGRAEDESSHYVRLTRPFYIGASEVTQAQWHAMTGQNPSKFKNEPDSPRRPVEYISFDDIQQKFIKQIQCIAPDGWTFRLPTEAEWEYACRAGTDTPYFVGQNLTTQQANYRGSDENAGAELTWTSMAKFVFPVDRKETTPVDMFPPNAFGLYDMHGNVWEWCDDYYDEFFYQNEHATDPLNTRPCEDRVLRGGSWNYGPYFCRSAKRDRAHPNSRYFNFGFRLACAMPPKKDDNE